MTFSIAAGQSEQLAVNSEPVTETEREMSECWLCRAPSQVTCSACPASSCSASHHRLHSEAGGGQGCLPARILYREGVGNTVVAATDIRPGQTILTEQPAVWGPNLKSGPKCCNCLARWRGFTCPDCQFPVCDEACARGPHHTIECGLLASLDIDITFSLGEAANPAMSLINVVRLLRLGVTSPDTASRVMMLMDHTSEIMACPELREMWEVTAVKPLTRGLGPSSPFSAGDVMRAVGVLQTNTVSLAVPGQRHGLYTALYPTFSFLSHSCICNAKFNILRDRTLHLVAQTHIKAGEEITIQYTTPMLGNVQRQQKISKNWYFDCCCARCSDPSELGTNLSGVLCPLSSCQGVLLPRPGLPQYSCTAQPCPGSLSHLQVAAMEAELQAELDQTEPADVGALQKVLSSWQTKLASSHFLVLLIKRKLLAALKLITTPERETLTREQILSDLDQNN